MNASLADEFIAHHRTSGEDQSLSRRLLEVASLASSFAGKIGLLDAGELVGLLHDLGKYSSAFQVQADGFRKSESGAVVMDDNARKEILIAWQKRKQEEIQHPYSWGADRIGIAAVCAGIVASTIYPG